MASITQDLTHLKADMEELNNRLSEIELSTIKPIHTRPTHEVEDPINLDIIEVVADIHSSEENSNISTTTIDEFVAQGSTADPQLN